MRPVALPLTAERPAKSRSPDILFGLAKVNSGYQRLEYVVDLQSPAS
jgi:hypothetical protein